MLEWLPTVLAGGAVSAVVGAVVLSYKQLNDRGRRPAELRKLAARLEAPFDAKAERVFREPLVALPLFRIGLRAKPTNLLTMPRGRFDAFLAFDYQYEFAGGDSKRLFFSVAAFKLPTPALPPFDLRPEHALDRVLDVFGGKDLDFDSDPAFSKLYRLTSPDPMKTVVHFRAEVREALRSAPGWSAQANGLWLVLFRQQVGAEGMELFLSRARTVGHAFLLDEK